MYFTFRIASTDLEYFVYNECFWRINLLSLSVCAMVCYFIEAIEALPEPLIHCHRPLGHRKTGRSKKEYEAPISYT